MTKSELFGRLKADGLDRYFGLDVTAPPDNAFVLDQENGLWVVQYFERGASDFVASFRYEHDACGFLYWKIHDDLSLTPSSSTRKWRVPN